MVDQMPDSSRPSVAARPVSTSPASSAPATDKAASPVSRSWRFTHRTTWVMPASETAAAWSSGASSASARSVQWDASPPTPPGRAAPTIARAVSRAVSQSRQEVTGDHLIGVTPAGGLTVPAGSNSQHRP